jgi:hypothetical protein
MVETIEKMTIKRKDEWRKKSKGEGTKSKNELGMINRDEPTTGLTQFARRPCKNAH